MILYGKFPFDPSTRARFASGELREEWFARYPQLFDENDLRLARNQPESHFFEWLAAIKIFHDTGWLSLVEKYVYTNHPAKLELFTSLVPPEVPRLFRSHYFGRRQPPDLFVYSPERSDWYFCEVKGGSDRLRKEQRIVFAMLERMTGRPVRIIHFVPDRPSSAVQDGA